MPKAIEEFWTSPTAERHMLDDHGVCLEEAVEAAESCSNYRRTYGSTRTERRYYVAGKTRDGRRLWVVFADEGNGRARIITAREPDTLQERARHKRMKGD